ncbi:hypothetical protein DPEC_G00329170 [Dallia pectoralis]|uniref:Uncharacterized protein n=1 Tax=Dallia pectoralis TaxID=75939 RepID=A0ACC2F8J0_DALPE|nr:hypothetical protein DPEC_G00329170 [Dallia pectoralis]
MLIDFRKKALRVAPSDGLCVREFVLKTSYGAFIAGVLGCSIVFQFTFLSAKKRLRVLVNTCFQITGCLSEVWPDFFEPQNKMKAFAILGDSCPQLAVPNASWDTACAM